MAAMDNLANTMEANAAATLQAVQRLGQSAGNGNGNDEGNANDYAGENGDTVGGYGACFTGAACSLQSICRVCHLLVSRRGPALVASKVSLATTSEHRHSMGGVPNSLLQEVFSRVFKRSEGDGTDAAEARGLKDDIMTVVAPMEIQIFSDLVNKARVVEEYAKMVASSRETYRSNPSRERVDYLGPKRQNFKKDGHGPQHLLGQGNSRRDNNA
ncbi:hypothetical protein AHAS_Ahas20G0264200 [Arachis hypogaea]